MEVTFKYSIITTDLRPNNKHKLEICGDEPSDLNPRPLKRRRESEHEVEAIVEEEKEEEEEEEQQPSSEEVEQNVMALARLTTCFEELKGKTGGMAELLMRNDLQECLPMIQILTAQIEAIKNRIYEKKAFYSLWMDSSRPLKLNLGYYGLLPVELIYVVFSFLDGKELMILGQVCSLFYEIAQDESLWKGLAERLWPTSIALGQKPENRSWKWLYKAKTRTFRQEEIRNGVGRFVLPYGNLYEGEWRNNKRHGQGTGIMKDGRRYDGQWENDMRSGFGIFRWPLDCGANGGDTYVGEWKDSKRHGQGVYTWVDGTKYDGQWGDGKREGMGCVVWPDGRKYVGEYKDGKMEGKGTFTWPDQSVYVGDYVNGKRHGNGKYTYSNGGIYEGEWEGGMRHGKGTLWKSTGEKYEGQWKWNAPYGLGTVTYKDGRQVEKQWIEDELLISP